MGASFLITLREGLEIFLVLAILLAYLDKTGRGSEAGVVWRGAGLAALVCIAVGVVINAAVGGLNGTVEPAVEGIIAITAASVLTWMIFWMRSHSRDLGAHLREQLDNATSHRALMLVAFVAVIREGLETVLFLLGVNSGQHNGTKEVIGGVVGLFIAAVLGRLVYMGGNRVNLRVFFNVTGMVLIFFAAGLFAQSFHELFDFAGINSGWLAHHAWNLQSGPFASGTFYDFLEGLFRWEASPERIRVIAYVLYLVPVMVLFRKGARAKTA